MARSYSSTASGDFSTFMAGKVGELIMTLLTAGKAAGARKAAAKGAAAKYGVDLATDPGEFYGRELRDRSIRSLLGKSFVPKENMLDIIARGQSVSDPLIGTPVHVRNLPEYQNIASPEEKAFKSRGSIPYKPTATGAEKPVKVTDPKLGVFLAKVAEALTSSVTSLNEKMTETEGTIVASKEGISIIARQLEQNSDILESKLDSIIDILRRQTELAKISEDNVETRQKLLEQNKQDNESGTRRFVPVGEDPEKTKIINIQEDAKEIGSDNNTDPLPYNDTGEYGGFERGGIASGPDSGYYAKLHGDELIVPLDNNYTQGEPSAIDGKVRRPPMMAERGTLPYDKSTPSMQSFGSMPNMFAKTIAPDIPNIDLSKEEQKLHTAMQLPTQAAGVVMLGSLRRSLVGMGPAAGDVSAELQEIAGPIADSFGIKNTMVNAMGSRAALEINQNVNQTKTKSRNPIAAQKIGEDKRNWFQRLPLIGGLFGGGDRGVNYGTGGILRGQLARMLTPSWLPGSNTVRNRLLRGSINPFGQRTVSTGAAGRVRVPVYHGRKGFGTLANDPLREFYSSPDIKTGGRFAQANQLTKGSSPVPRGGTNYRGNLPQRYIDKYGSRTLQGFRQIKMSDTAANRAFKEATGNPTRRVRPNLNFGAVLGRRTAGIGRRLTSLAAKANPYTLAAEIIIEDITKGHNLTEEEWMNGPGTLGYMERMMAERNGGTQTIQPAIGPPQRIRPAQVESGSKNAFFNKMSAKVQQLDPIYLNNSQSTQAGSQKPISPISAKGNSGLDVFFPSWLK